MRDLSAFLGALLRRPAGVGAIAPSSDALADAMVGLAAIKPEHVVVELGAGTGPMTKALLAAHGNNPILVLEPDKGLAEACRRNVPGAEVIEDYAQALPGLLDARGHSHADRVVSSLPFAAWPPELQDEVLDAIVAAMAPQARMVTFTYAHSPWLPAGRRARARLEHHFDRVVASPVVWGNVPPALVYVCDRGTIAG